MEAKPAFLAQHKLAIEQALTLAINAASQTDSLKDPIIFIAEHLRANAGSSLEVDTMVDTQQGLRASSSLVVGLRAEVEKLRAELLVAQGASLSIVQLREALVEMDESLLCRFQQEDIVLVDREFLLSRPEDWRVMRRQDLDPEAFIKAKDAIQLVEDGKRNIGVLSYGWPTRGNPDPSGAYLEKIQMFLREHPTIKAVFWDYMSLHQCPRSTEEDVQFQAALGSMADLYASPLSTVVMQLTVVPAMPSNFDGVVHMLNLPTGSDEHKLREAFQAVGMPETLQRQIETVQMLADSEARLSCTSHSIAEALVTWMEEGHDDCADLPQGVAVFLAYNETPYENRGWCILEDAVATELLAWSMAYPRTNQMIESIVSESESVAGNAKVYVLTQEEQGESYIKQVSAGAEDLMLKKETTMTRLQLAKFTSGADERRVVKLYQDYRMKIRRKITKLAAKNNEEEEVKRFARQSSEGSFCFSARR